MERLPQTKMKNPDDPQRNGNAKVYISIETADAVVRVQGDAAIKRPRSKRASS